MICTLVRMLVSGSASSEFSTPVFWLISDLEYGVLDATDRLRVAGCAGGAGRLRSIRAGQPAAPPADWSGHGWTFRGPVAGPERDDAVAGTGVPGGGHAGRRPRRAAGTPGGDRGRVAAVPDEH